MSEEVVDPYRDARMTVIEHLTELRLRVIKMLVAFAVGFAIAWTWVEQIFALLQRPLQIAAPEAALAQMHHKDLSEPFFVLLKTAIFGGFFIAVPFILYQIWQFVAPGLYDHEKRAVLPFVALSYLFFMMGSGFCFWIVLPQGYEFLLNFSADISQPELMMSEYLAITTKLLIGFGVIFQLPVISMFLSSIGILTHRDLLKFWRYAIVASFIVAALLTPPDVVTQVLMAIPLCILYFLSIGVAWYFTTRREKRAALEET